MASLACPNCAGVKWDPHDCKSPGCFWQVCKKCRLIADMVNKRVAINSQDHPLFQKL